MSSLVATLLVMVTCIFSLNLVAAAPISLANVLPAQEGTQAGSTSEYTAIKDYYSSGVTSNICLRQTTIKTCDIIGLFAGLTYEAGMECCNSKHHGYAGYGTRGQTVIDRLRSGTASGKVGTCTWRIDPFAIRLVLAFFQALGGNAQRPIQVGSFTVDCEFNKGAEECGEGCTEGLRLEAKGPLWYVPNAAITTTPALEGTNLCADIVNEITDVFDRRMPPRSTAPPAQSGVSAPTPSPATTPGPEGSKAGEPDQPDPPSKPSEWATLAQGISQFMPRTPTVGVSTRRAPQRNPTTGPGPQGQPRAPPAGVQSASDMERETVAAEVQYSYEGRRETELAQTYYRAEVLVAYGHVQITSKHSGHKYDEGFMESTLIYDIDRQDGDIETIVPDGNTFITEPYRMDLTLKSSGYGQYYGGNE